MRPSGLALRTLLRTRTIRPWMAQETQYCIFMYSFGSTNWLYTLASRMSRCDEASTMLRTWKRLMALSFGTQREQLEQRTMAVWPRPWLERPLFLRLDGIVGGGLDQMISRSLVMPVCGLE